MKKKNYIIVDELNRWHDVGYDATDEEIKNVVNEVKQRLAGEGETNTELIVFEIVDKGKTM